MNCNLSIHIRSFLVCTLLLAGCTDKDAPGIEEVATIPLQLMVNAVSGSTDTRSVVSQTGTASGQVGEIGICLALASDGHSAYATPEASSALFTLSGSDVWTASRPVNLRSAQARLYAWYPAVESNLTTVDNGTARTVAITLLASQTFDGANATDCSQSDYLYGSASGTVGDATPITVNRDNNNPTVYLQHALTRLIFTIEYKAGRVPDSEYDWVKSISLEGPFHAGACTLQLNDGTLFFSSSATPVTLTFSAAQNPQLPGNIGTPARVAYGLVAPKGTTTQSVTVKLVLGQKSTSTNDRTLTSTTNLFNAEWTKGNSYTYKLLLDKNDITLKSVSIKGWTDAPSGDSTEVPPVIG